MAESNKTIDTLRKEIENGSNQQAKDQMLWHLYNSLGHEYQNAVNDGKELSNLVILDELNPELVSLAQEISQAFLDRSQATSFTRVYAKTVRVVEVVVFMKILA